MVLITKKTYEMNGISEKLNLQKISAQELSRIISPGEIIRNYEISGEIFIDSSMPETINFHNCKFSKLTILDKLVRLAIHSCDFYEIVIKGDIQYLSLLSINSTHALIHAENILIDDIYISDCQLIDSLILGQLGKVEVDEFYCFQSTIKSLGLFGTYEKVVFNKGNQITTLQIDGEFKDVQIVHTLLPNEQISPNKFEDIFYSNRFEKSRLKIENSAIKNLYAFGQHFDSYIELNEVNCEEVVFRENFGTNGIIKIKACDKLSKISFFTADIPNLEIFNSNFKNTSFITGQSIIEKIKWQSVEWSEKLEQYTDPKLDISFRGETLRYLKLNAFNQQDTINYIKFYSLELQDYEKLIQVKKWYSEDRVLLYLNKISNNHGLSWKRGLCFSIGIGTLFFIPNLFLLNNPYWEFGWSNWSDFREVLDITLKLFSQSLYAAHSFDYLKEYNPKGIVFLIDLIGRIFLTYGYYQTIVAFRKFGRK